MQLTLADAGLERTDLVQSGDWRDQVASLQQSKLEVDSALPPGTLVQVTEEYATCRWFFWQIIAVQ